MTSEGMVRLSSFVIVLSSVAIWEAIAPRRKLQTGRGWRWFANLALILLGTAVCRVIFPVMPVGMAILAGERHWGFLNLVEFPVYFEALLAVLVLDFAIYLQHVMFHHHPLLWRLHRMHHTDLDLDVTSGNRFHPFEIVISLAIKLAVIAVLGASPFAVLTFEVLLNACAMFNHGNIKIALSLDRWLRLFLVTPDMHRVHHSVYPSETNSNYGFCMAWWDRLCNTYRDQPRMGHEGMIIGLKEFRNPEVLKLQHLLLQPFVRIRG